MDLIRVIPNFWRLSRVISTFARTGALARILEEFDAPPRVAVPIRAIGAIAAPFGLKGDASLPPVARTALARVNR